MIGALANYKKDNWEDKLVDFEVVYSSAVNSTTLCTSFYVNYGIHPRTIPFEGLTTNNTSALSFLDTIHDTMKFVHERIIKQNTKTA